MTVHTDLPDYEYIIEPDRVTTAILELQEAVVGAFRQHDKDLRAEVEKVNSQIRWLIGVVALIGAAVLVWPRRKNA